MSEMRIARFDALECRLERTPWPFAEERRGEIEAHWQGVVASKPASFNGQILLLQQWQADGGLFRGSYHQTDYASFLAWRDFGHPGEPRWNCFSMAALESADGAFVLGEMAAHTSNAGAIYFAAGTPDLSDLAGEAVDLAGSVIREMAEETGLSIAEVSIDEGWIAVFHGPRIAMMRSVRSPLQAIDLKRKIETYLASDPKAELARIHLVRSPADLKADRMPAFQRAYLEHRFANG